MSLTFTPLPKIPLIHPGDDLVEILLNSLQTAKVTLEDGDILVLAQKIVSKSEGRLVNLSLSEALGRSAEVGRPEQQGCTPG